TGPHLLGHLRLLAERGARELPDLERATRELEELLLEEVGEIAVGGVARLVVAEGEGLRFLGASPARYPGRGADGQGGGAGQERASRQHGRPPRRRRCGP